MSHILEQSTLRILTPEGQTVGAGFIVAPGLAVTCAHVVAAAKSGPGQTVGVANARGEARQTADVLAEGWSPDTLNDLAFLRLRAADPGLVSVPLSSARDRDTHPYTSLGFPSDPQYDGDTPLGELGGLIQSKVAGRADLLRIQGAEIRPGMSGGAVLDVQAAQVVGMICEFLDRDGARRAYALTADTICQSAPVDLVLEPPKGQTGLVVNVTQIIQVAAFVPQADLGQSKAAYLSFLKGAYRALDFRGIRQLDSFAREMLLEEVYVPLVARPEAPEGDTWERRLAGRRVGLDAFPEESLAWIPKGDALPLKVEEALGKQPRVVVLGDPGSGKSTLLKYLALRLADEPGAPLPVLVPLNAYARELQRSDLSLQSFLPKYFGGLSKDLENLQGLFDAAIRAGQAVILLDGLDEVQDRRPHLVHKVEAFADRAVAAGCKLVVTSRIVGYKDAPLAAKNWSLYTLLDFERPAIEDFARKWCLAFEKGSRGQLDEPAQAAAETERKALMDAIDANPGVARLASNPLLLTILALIKRQGVSLPQRRVELYDLYLDTLIRSWNKARALDRQPVGPELDTNQILMTLGPLALWLRAANPSAGVVSEDELLAELTRHFMGEDWGFKRGEAAIHAREFLESVHHYSNLLVERGQGQYGFMHLTFEEMLAAYGLYQGEIADSLAIIQTHLTDPAWRETILLAVGVWGLANKKPREAAKVVREMLKMACDGPDACQNALMAGACLEDVGETGLGRAAANEVIDTLLAVAQNRGLPPPTQRDAGFILGRLAANNSFFLERIRPDLDDWVRIPSGKFLYGDKKKPVVIKRPFEIGKYPVTNLQYRRFVEAGGYDLCDYWSEEGWAWRTGIYDSQAESELKMYLEARTVEKRTQPFFWSDPKWNNPLAPVVGVTWFEAEAYANWLSRQLQREVRLPTEQEWERVARGTDGREYPWGNGFDRQLLNCAEFWAQQEDLSEYEKWSAWFKSDSYKKASTSMVGQFQGHSPEGAFDLSGNVWEWTGSLYNIEKPEIVLRGGSWYFYRGFARCASRLWFSRVSFRYIIGFRVLSPGAS
jgi:formylglycine-generating enzyme required for sulfatase activity/energy-coupling factor transporter ATP-binding protein EcfA2